MTPNNPNNTNNTYKHTGISFNRDFELLTHLTYLLVSNWTTPPNRTKTSVSAARTLSRYTAHGNGMPLQAVGSNISSDDKLNDMYTDNGLRSQTQTESLSTYRETGSSASQRPLQRQLMQQGSRELMSNLMQRDGVVDDGRLYMPNLRYFACLSCEGKETNFSNIFSAPVFDCREESNLIVMCRTDWNTSYNDFARYSWFWFSPKFD